MMAASSSKKIQIVLHGFGNVGAVLKELAISDSRVNVVSVIAHANFTAMDKSALKDADVIIDFSHGTAVLPLVQFVAKHNPNVRIVTGSSGWHNNIEKVRLVVDEKHLFFLYGANFSIGTALYMEIVRYSAKLFNKFSGFDPALLDVHHHLKKDMPSGTARNIAQIIVDETDSKNSVLYGMQEEPIRPDQLHVNCLRVGANKGSHEVYFDAADEVVTMTQQTRDRGAYASGSIEAALWLMQRDKPGFYTFDQYIQEIITK
jgi:4-hydroxy-tetrahydrodipicolinate reductase